MEKPERSVYTAQDFLQWREADGLDLTPKFQRRGVWSPQARSFFIDSLLRQMPVPPIYIRAIQGPDRHRVVRQVVDGQQRVACILDFIDGKFRLSKTLDEQWGAKSFEGISPDERQRIMTYSFSVEQFHGVSDLEVLEIFARLNTYSVPLNDQELRNGRYFGLFKRSVYALAYQHLEFWRRHGIFTERSVARMLEVELTSELVIAQMDGMQDKKKSISTFYAQYDEEFPARKTMERRFREVVDTINEVFPDTLSATEFHRPPLFYTLFCAIYHRQHGLPKVRFPTPRRPLNRTERLGIVETVEKLSSIVAVGRSGEPVPRSFETFVAACLRQTDNIKPREERFKTLYTLTF